MLVNGIEPSATNIGTPLEENSRLRAATPSTDAATFSNAAKSLALSGDGITGTVATATQGLNGKKVVFDFATGSLSINDVKLDLKGFAKGMQDDLVVQEDGGGYRVWNLSTGKSATVDAQGKLTLPGEDETPPAIDPSAQMVFVNNSGTYRPVSGNAGMTVFNRKADSILNTGSGNDMVFALNGISGNVTMGGGNDALYTSKITGTVDMGDGDAFVRTKTASNGHLTAGKDGDVLLDAVKGGLGGITINAGSNAGMVEVNAASMAGTRLNLSSARNVLVDVKGNVGANSEFQLGQASNNVKINGAFSSSQVVAGASSATTFHAGSIGGSGGSISLGNGDNEISVRGAVSGVSINMGMGANRFYAGRITGTGKNQVMLSMGGTGLAEQIVRVSGASNQFIYQGGAGNDNLTLQGAVSNSQLDLGDGINTVDLTKSNNKRAAFSFNNTSISASGASGATSITAGAFTGKKENSAINLGDGGNLLNFSGKVSKAEIDMGEGSNTLNAASVGGTKNFSVKLSMGQGGASTQTVNISGATSNLEYLGGNGTDQIKILGALSNSSLDLGEGSNSVSLRGKRNTWAAEKAYGIHSSSIRSAEDSSTTIDAGSLNGTGKAPSSITLGDGNNLVNLSGKLNGTNISMGGGNNVLNAKGINGNAITGVSVEMLGTGSNTMNITGGVNFLSYAGGQGDDIINLLGNLNRSELDLDAGNNTVNMVGKTAEGKDKGYTINGSVIKAGGSTDNTNTIHAGGVTGTAAKRSHIELNAGTNTVNLFGRLSGADVDLNGDVNALYAKGVGGTANSEVNVNMGETGSSAANTMGITGAASFLNYTGQAGSDNITILGLLSRSDLSLGSGANTLNMKGKTKPTAKETAYGIKSSSVRATNEGDASLSITAGAVSGTAKNQSSFELGAKNNVLQLTSLGNTKVSVGGGMTLNVDKLSGISLDLGTVSNTINVAKSLGGAGAAGVIINTRQSGADITQTINVTGATSNLTYKGGEGADILNLGGNVAASTIDLGSGANTLTTTNATNAGQGILRGVSIRSGGDSTITVNGMTNSGSVLSAIESTTSSGTLNLTIKGMIGGTAMKLGGDKAVLNLGTVTSGSSVSSRVNISGNNLGSAEIIADNIYGANFYFTNSGDTSIKVSGTMGATNVILGSGANSVEAGAVDHSRLSMGNGSYAGVTAGSITDSQVMLTGAGTNILRADTIGRTNAISLGGQAGSVNTLEVNGTMAGATVILGSAGINNIYAESIVGGKILSADSSQADNAITAAYAENAAISLSGNRNLVDIDNLNQSTVGMMGNNNTLGKATGGNTVTSSRIIMQGEGSNTIYADSLSGKVQLNGANSLLGVKGELNADIILGQGNHVLGVAGQTTWKGGSVTLGDDAPFSGAATIQGNTVDGLNISATGAATGNATVNMAGSIANANMNFGQVNTTVSASAITDSTIAMSGASNSLTSGDIESSTLRFDGSSVLKAGKLNNVDLAMSGSLAEMYVQEASGSTVAMSATRNLANFTGNSTGMNTGNAGAVVSDSNLSFSGNNEVTLGNMVGGNLSLAGTSMVYAVSASGSISAAGSNYLRIGTLSGSLKLAGLNTLHIGLLAGGLVQGATDGSSTATITGINNGSTVAFTSALGDTLTTARPFDDTVAQTINGVTDLNGSTGLTVDPSLVAETGIR